VCPQCGHQQSDPLKAKISTGKTPHHEEPDGHSFLLWSLALLSPSFLCAAVGYLIFGIKGVLAGFFTGLIFYLFIDIG
jgi:UPF0716 family protein affecting phage T7 exclusion